MSIHDKLAAAHNRAAAIFGSDENKWSLDGVEFPGVPGSNPLEGGDSDESAVKGGPSTQQKTPANPWVSAQKSLFSNPDKIRKGDSITNMKTGKKYRIADIRNLPGDPLLNFQIHL